MSRDERSSSGAKESDLMVVASASAVNPVDPVIQQNPKTRDDSLPLTI